MTVYLPNVTKMLGGPDGWHTPFIVQNIGTSPTDLEMSFFSFSTGALARTRNVGGLMPRRSVFHDPNSDPELAPGGQFAVVVRSFGSPIAAIVNEHRGAARQEAMSYAGFATGTTNVYLPFVAKFASGWLTTFVIQNLGSAGADIMVQLVSFDGARRATVTRKIAPGRAQFVDPSVEASLADGVEYSAALTANQPIAVVVNNHNEAPTAVAPMAFSYGGIGGIGFPSQAYVPYVVSDSGPFAGTSRIIVQNAGTSDAVPTLRFQSLDALDSFPDLLLRVSDAITAPEPIKPNQSWAFDPHSTLDPGSNTCYISGPRGQCVALGAYSLVVSGGNFAVLNVTRSATTALGYTGQNPSSQVYLPNVTRALGGRNGWTTPIVVQSATARQITVSWYRFGDGSLAATQSLKMLPTLARLVDPASVAGLSDDAQYSVAVDGNGGHVAAVVLEYNYQGGDGAMAYEGVPSLGEWPALPVPPAGRRATVDRPDDVQGHQVHVLYVVPSDGADEGLDTDGRLARSVAAFQEWLASRTGGRRLRLDTYQGSLDVGFYRLPVADAVMRRLPIEFELERLLALGGLLQPNKAYAVYYGGSEDGGCGGAAAWLVGAVWLRSTDQASGLPCAGPESLAPEGAPTYLDLGMLHELMHVFDVVKPCAPHYASIGHVSDDPRDLMYAGPSPWQPSVLDTGNDDYYKHRNRGCPDLATSPWLAPQPR